MSEIEVEKIHTFTGHRDSIYALTKGESENEFFTASADGMLVKWDMTKPDEGKLVAKTNNSIYSIFYWQEKKILLVGENFHGLHVIDTATETQLKSIKLTDSSIFDIKTYQNQILIACGNGDLIVYNFDKEQIIFHKNLSTQSARCIAIGEKEFAIGFSDHYIRVLNFNFEEIHAFEAHKNSVFSLKYLKGKPFLISGSRDAHLKIWNTDKNYELEESIVAHMYAINHIDIQDSKEYFATCSMDKTIKIWDASNFKLKKVIDKSRHAGHGTSINNVMWISNQNLLVSVSDDRCISIWKLTFNKKILK